MRNHFFQVATLVASFGLFATSAAAQKFIVPATLTAGTSVSVGVNDPSRANQTITVTIDGGPGTSPETIKVQLDGSGNGSSNWTVNSTWDIANFNSGTMGQVSRWINGVVPASS